MSEQANKNVTLISSDEFSFIIPKPVALKAGMLADMLGEDSAFSESMSNTCNLDIRGVVLEKVCEYLLFKQRYESVDNKETVPDFQERIPPEIALELLVAADYLQSKLRAH
ncbi:Elongin-C [Wallemia ichthyophaga EXF-994]|uniref:Elongin-C n=1 Tax=Wallemia ichthyophaga (strain EXF-994 / CBS 113033) TaxID=1299270 RepID=R9AU98_WALI9|nr:Elongin-C [Wallemia ichthyophaga EXF-994]EOR03676.1 Elongin-C [Wallemia ichthyophaga EXF-994]